MNRYIDREKYFNELAYTSRTYYIDYLKPYKALNAQCRILEIGCGEGGNLLPFAEMGCYVEGVDIADNKIANAISFFGKRGLKGDFHSDNFITTSIFDGQELFDVVLIHDVIEHIEPEDKNAFFSRIKSLLKADGIVFWGFPAWEMPFGGHQQICKSKMCRIPFIHLLPEALYKGYLHLFKESGKQIDELMSIRRSKMTVERFERLCEIEGYKTLDRTLWLVSPHYKVKFNLKPRKLWRWLGAIPYLRNFLATSCFYIVSAK